ncbi:MAG: aspartate--tRNA ligase [Candidatus Colwellbacteria bacterium CG10_big_fil_rev_8_21_14_0_10_41_28]|uniref:Aspartate--tRNA(Asp/Asn) ligase n=1 Tax=Candidatus Colwellbacteria bacterium CG10_big_fil_rev_8_21_14_0_10_41_28 TaxID=1974539 RepID=A0A2H0VH81_9BACT|nr:MAG: aspartate--tRNA ligase [Candidatus Colwellbacteria bacterium CG10_big_fil_rev_8_21_14_0_10_41_28]
MRVLIKETPEHIGEKIELNGWVDTRRDHGKLIFIDLRDRSGLVQVVFNGKNQEAYKIADSLRPEWVIKLVGEVKERPDGMKNNDLPTGGVEISVEKIEVLNESETPPFDIHSDGLDINEAQRLKYRYLDLRRPRLQRNIKLRSELIQKAREILFEMDFTEIETPLLSKSTPEGSRDFIVPSRLYPGKFFALPQSPQQYKQLLMTAGFERYFQIARAIRDEDLRADRGFEHTQIDMELSFVDRDQFMAIDEELMTRVFEGLGYKIKEKPFPVVTYEEAMEKHGADKFDLRGDKDKEDGVLAFAWVVDFPFFEKDDGGGWTFTHNPFSMPKEEFLDDFLKGKNIENILTTQYDLVCNGLEVGGGSIRAHKPEILESTFKIMGYDKETIDEQFGYMLEAFKYGAPPHGGTAHGVERLLMAATGEEYLREVQAFPQSGTGQTSVMNAPSEISKKQLEELGIEIKKKKK